LSAVDAHAIDQVLTALAGITEPGDPRTRQQRRADALVDVLLGRVSNGCHVVWVRREALFVRVEVRDLRRRPVAAGR
jgi:hypothetical protein